MSVASCSSSSICFRTRWISLDTSPNRVEEMSLGVLGLVLERGAGAEAEGLGSVATARTRRDGRRRRRPGSDAARPGRRTKPPQCSRCGAADAAAAAASMGKKKLSFFGEDPEVEEEEEEEFAAQ